MNNDGPRTIPDLSLLAYDNTHVRAHKALVHQTDEVQVSVYMLDAGGRIPPHSHNASWDISFVFEGEIEVRFIEGDTPRTLRCLRHSMNVVPPGVIHEISNPSTGEPAKFLLVQSPSRGFGFVRADPAGSA